MALYYTRLFFTYILSLALVFPLAFATGDWYFAIFGGLVTTFCFGYHFIKSRNRFGSFLNGVLMGVLASLSIWVLDFIDTGHTLRDNHFFVASFFVLFCLSSYVTFQELRKRSLYLLLFNLLVLAGFILFLIFTRSTREKVGWIILFGGLLGILVGFVLSFIFEKFFKVGLAIFGKIWNYIEVLLKPALIFFTGYLTIGALYAGVYNLIFSFSPSAFTFPTDQIAFLDFLLYAVDTMTTGGDSAVQANSLLAQLVNTLNVFTAIVWMTVILAATIGHSSERFKDIAAMHQKSGKKSPKKRKKPLSKKSKVIQ